MKKIIIFLTMIAPGLALAAAGLPSNKDVRNILNESGLAPLQYSQLGTQVVDHNVRLVRAKYDFNIQGGSSLATINLLDVDGKDAVIPLGAVIKQATISVLQQPNFSGTNARIALNSEAAGDLKASAATSGYAVGFTAGLPVGTAATMIKITADRTLGMTLAGGDLVIGKFNVFVEYYVSQ